MTVPNIRFSGFNREWEKRDLFSIFEISKNHNNERLFTQRDVLSVSDEYGVVNQIKLQGRSFAADDVSNYKVVSTGQIIYTRSPLKAKPFGIIKLAKEEGIVSPLYIVNNVKNGNNPEFMNYVFDSPAKTNNYLLPLVRIGAKHTMNISNDEWLSGKVIIPLEAEQQKIGSFFSNLDRLITLQDKKVARLKEMKKGLMQKIFSRQIGFKADDGSEYPEWEEKRIGSFAKCYAGATPNTKIKEYWENGTIPWMSSGEVNQGIVYSTKKFITELGYKSYSTKMIPPNTVVMALAGQGKTRGMVALVKIELCTNQSLAAIVTDNSVDDKYLYSFLQTQYDNLRLISSGDGTRGGLNLKLINEYVVPLPNIEEQQKIAALLSSTDNLIRAAEKKLASLKEIKKGLMQKMFV